MYEFIRLTEKDVIYIYIYIYIYIIFVIFVCSLRHGFGDCRKPLVETAALVEDIVYRQMVDIVSTEIFMVLKTFCILLHFCCIFIADFL